MGRDGGREGVGGWEVGLPLVELKILVPLIELENFIYVVEDVEFIVQLKTSIFPHHVFKNINSILNTPLVELKLQKVPSCFKMLNCLVELKIRGWG